MAQLFMDLSTPLGTGFGDTRRDPGPQSKDDLAEKQTQSPPKPHDGASMKNLHRLATVLLLSLLLLPTAFAQRMYDGSGRPIGRVDSERYYNASGQPMGRVDGERIYDGSGRPLGRIDGDRVYNASGSPIGRIDGDRLYSASGSPMGRMDGERLYDGSGRPIGRADGLRRMQMIVFFYFFM